MFGEFVRKTGFKIGGALLQSDRFAWMLFAMRKTGIVRMVHVLCDYLERRNPTEEMLQYRKIAESHQKELRKIGGGISQMRKADGYTAIFSSTGVQRKENI